MCEMGGRAGRWVSFLLHELAQTFSHMCEGVLFWFWNPLAHTTCLLALCRNPFKLFYTLGEKPLILSSKPESPPFSLSVVCVTTHSKTLTFRRLHSGATPGREKKKKVCANNFSATLNVPSWADSVCLNFFLFRSCLSAHTHTFCVQRVYTTWQAGSSVLQGARMNNFSTF